jgi:RNA polymerase sigma-70 factor (ECF subfamily)
VESSERALLQRDLTNLADGDRDAFRPVFVRLWPVVRAFARRRVAPEDAEDVAQRALLRLFLRASEFDPQRDALAWALGIAAWEIRSLQRWRGRKREVPVPEGSGVDLLIGSEDPTPEEQLLSGERDRALHEALADLAPADAAALRAFADGDRPSGAAFRKRLQRAHARLRQAWMARHG